MSVQATTWVWDHSRAKGGTLLVLLAIADAANAQGAESCQSVATICRMTRCGETTVHRAIKELIGMGEIAHVGTSRRYSGTRIYDLPMARGGSQSGTPGVKGGAIDDVEGVPSATKGGATSSTQPQKTYPKKDTPVVSVPSPFDQWWEHWPLKTGKKEAERAFKGAAKKAPLVALIAAVTAQTPTIIDRANRGYVLRAATWLNNERWTEELSQLVQEPESKYDQIRRYSQ